MKAYIEFLIGLGMGILLMRGDWIGIVICSVFAIPILIVLRWDDDMASKFPRWLGGMSDGFAPPSILDTDAQAIVTEARQKINKTDDDKV